MPSSQSLAAFSTTALVCYGGLFARLVWRLWRVRISAATHRRRLHTARARRAWTTLISTWHTPLFLLGIAIAASRVALFVEILTLERQSTSSSTRELRRLQWLLLELPTALISILAAYLLFFHAHVVLFRVWPLRFDSTALSFRVLLGAFSASILSVVTLTAYARETQEPLLSSMGWTRFQLKYFAVIFIVLGAMLLKYQSASAEVQWTERDAGRLLVVSPRGVHMALLAQTLLAMALVLRGAMSAMLTISFQDDEPLIPSDPQAIGCMTFFVIYGGWELLAISVIDTLCSSVPVASRARQLVQPDGGEPIPSDLPVVHFAVRSPREAVGEYLRSAALVLESRSRIQRHNRSFPGTSSYEDEGSSMAIALDVDGADSRVMVGGGALASAHEPLLASHYDDDHAGDSSEEDDGH